MVNPGHTDSAGWRDGFWRTMLDSSNRVHRRAYMVATFALVVVIGVADYLTGSELSFLVFYFVPVCLAVACAGWRFGSAIAMLSVATWLLGDIEAGAHYSNPFVPGWNALIALGAYLVVVWLLSSVLSLHRQMEQRVTERTGALREEIAERVRLEKVVLEITERERRSIGHELHDGLSQHLTGTALVAKALATRLGPRSHEDSAEMEKIVGLIESGIEQTRSLAKGLLLAEISRDGLVTALQGLASSVSAQHRIPCTFTCPSPVNLEEGGTATHLYRIAEEACRNAVRHADPSSIEIELNLGASSLDLVVRDNGRGLAPEAGKGHGLGLRIMAHRAAIMGSRFSADGRAGAGTTIRCSLPLSPHP